MHRSIVDIVLRESRLRGWILLSSPANILHPRGVPTGFRACMTIHHSSRCIPMYASRPPILVLRYTLCTSKAHHPLRESSRKPRIKLIHMGVTNLPSRFSKIVRDSLLSSRIIKRTRVISNLFLFLFFFLYISYNLFFLFIILSLFFFSFVRESIENTLELYTSIGKMTFHRCRGKLVDFFFRSEQQSLDGEPVPLIRQE